MNGIAFMHAYKFTHFDENTRVEKKDAGKFSFTDKIKAVIMGVDNPRPVNKTLPGINFESVHLNSSNKKIECWWIPKDSSIGSIILFHGYGGEKSSMLDKAEIFYGLGYNTLLVDFMGSGGSEGNRTTIGYFEAIQVKTAYDYVSTKTGGNIILFGTSLGAVAIMKALQDYQLGAKGIILECPFGSLLETLQARFRIMKFPSFPMANLLVLWGGVQNGFNAFQHNPVDYAKSISTPTLLLYGEKDERVSRKEIDEIFSNLQGLKTLKTYPEAGHENYLIKYGDVWRDDILSFTDNINN